MSGSAREDALNCGELPSLDKLTDFKKYENYFRHGGGGVKQDHSFSKVYECSIHTCMYVQVQKCVTEFRNILPSHQ
jgi:hypothetical protein